MTPSILIRRIRDRKAWRREIVGFFSDCIDMLEEGGRLLLYGNVLGSAVALASFLVIASVFIAGVKAVMG